MTDLRDPRLTERVRAAGISEADEAYCWAAFQEDDHTYAWRLRIRAVVGLPKHSTELEPPTVEEYQSMCARCGEEREFHGANGTLCPRVEGGMFFPTIGDKEAQEIVDEWSVDEVLRGVDRSLEMSAACIAGARALDAQEAQKAAVRRVLDEMGRS